MLLKDILDEFLLELEIRNYSKRTLKSYKNNNLLFFTYLEKEFEITEIEEVKPIQIKNYIKFLKGKGRKESYINGIIKCFRAYFKYSLEEDYIEINPMLKVGWIREGKILINAFTDDEVHKMINVFKGSDYMNIRNKCIMAILFDTGIRNLELCKLTNKDIKETTIIIKNGKGNKQRVVPISPYLKKIILRYVRCRDSYFLDRKMGDDTPFFLSYRFKPLTIEAIERVVKICGEKANIRKEIRCSPHTCRHYFAQAQLRNGLDVYSLSRLLGHENIAITKRYLQSIEDIDIVELSVKTSPLMNLR
ncbi:tyrosine-type recombinase/integrase [Clostridium baratii]|uniref:tyrosine-type recombinase/integrase n=1 Tax=Clostridium baratii TaxID=1561 RepID=UPI0030CE7C13